MTPRIDEPGGNVRRTFIRVGSSTPHGSPGADPARSMTPTIPRIFHWIWFGDSPLPEQHRAWIDGWLNLHPGWKHVLWTDANRPTLVNEEQFLAAYSLAQKSDIARYELVYRYGGVYVDTDTECLRSIDPLLEGVEAFAAKNRPDTVQNHPFGATPGHPWLAETIARLPAAMKAGDGGHHHTGPRFLTKVTLGRDDVTIFASTVFFHQRVQAPRDVPVDAYSVHHASRSWFPELVRLDIERVVPPGTAFVLVGNGRPMEVSGGRTALPFPERDGEWTGHSADDGDAIAALARARAGGVRFVVVPRPKAWLKTHPEFADYLRTRATVRLDNDRTMIVELGEGSQASRLAGQSTQSARRPPPHRERP